MILIGRFVPLRGVARPLTGQNSLGSFFVGIGRAELNEAKLGSAIVRVNSRFRDGESAMAKKNGDLLLKLAALIP